MRHASHSSDSPEAQQAAIPLRARDSSLASGEESHESQARPAAVSTDGGLAPVRALPWMERVAPYFRLTKPAMVALLLVTTLTAMILASPPWPTATLVLATLAGGALASGSANALNCWLDRDIDALMARTRGRPLPTHRVEPREAVVFALVLAVASSAIFIAFVNVLAGLLAMAGLLFYVVVYTWLLKRVTPLNVVIGGLAGGFPSLVGWAAATGSLGPLAFVLFGIVILWSPPHFWSLSLLIKDDYQKAGIPMLPVVAGEHETRRQILVFSAVLAPLTLLPYTADLVHLFYLGSASVLGAGLVGTAARLVLVPTASSARVAFLYSNIYHALLFVAMVMDKLQNGG